MSTQDRELLELAAKAAGISLYVDDYDQREGRYKRRINWNPLADDGDALRLAVKLRMGVLVCDEHTEIVMDDVTFPEIVEAHFGFDGGATRRAIVRAAAEIGRSA